MRFEIKSGGIAAILIGIAALSGAVFVLGLLAGYDVGRESAASQAQVATAYPLQEPPPAAAPSAAAAPAPAASGARVASTEAGGGAVASAALHLAKPPASSAGAVRESSGESSGSVATDSSSQATAPSEQASPSRTPERRLASTNPPKPAAHLADSRRRPYNIQIQAAMDHGGAEEMVRRLENLGYNAHITPTELAGQTWYKVEVGPYATQAEAEAAQSQLRVRYNSAYGRAGGGAPSSTGAAEPGD